MSTAIVTLSRYPDVFEQLRKSADHHEPDASKLLVGSGDEIQHPGNGWDFIRGPEPFRFSRNANVGLFLYHDQDVLLVNDDVELVEPIIAHCEAVAEAFPRVGIISPLVEGFAKSPYQRGVLPLESDPHVEPNLAFACVWLRRAMIREIGMLDERFSCSYEDDDYCRRAVLADWSPVVTGGVRVKHGFEGDTSSTSINRFYGGYNAILEENGRKFREKWGME